MHSMHSSKPRMSGTPAVAEQVFDRSSVVYLSLVHLLSETSRICANSTSKGDDGGLEASPPSAARDGREITHHGVITDGGTGVYGRQTFTGNAYVGKSW